MSGKYNKHYILAPVSAQAQLKRNRSEQPLKSTDSPRIVCDLSLEEVPLSLVDVSTIFTIRNYSSTNLFLVAVRSNSKMHKRS